MENHLLYVLILLEIGLKRCRLSHALLIPPWVLDYPLHDIYFLDVQTNDSSNLFA